MQRHSHPGGRPGWIGRGERRGRPATTAQDRSEIRGFLLGNLTDHWFTTEPEITIDDFEILVVGALDASELSGLATEERSVAESARIEAFREESRQRRIDIAQRVEQRFERKVSWGASAGETRHLFSTASAPVMTRLQMDQRHVLDTLVEAGVARSRSDALAWCVDLVAENEEAWLARLREALHDVAAARSEGPASRD
jgi:hypothetical protein